MGSPAQQTQAVENNKLSNDEAPILDTVDGQPQQYNYNDVRRNQPNPVVVNVNNSSNQVIESTPQIITQLLVNLMERNNIEIPEELRNRSRDSVVKEIADCLAIIGDNADHELSHLVSSIPVTWENAHKIFLDVSSCVFATGINWGRVAVLFLFACKLILPFVKQLSLVDIVIDWVKIFVTDRLASWIAERGGWNAVKELNSTAVKFFGVFAAGCLFACIINIFVLQK